MEVSIWDMIEEYVEILIVDLVEHFLYMNNFFFLSINIINKKSIRRMC